MKRNRYQKAKLNIISSLGYQFVALICGLIVPRLLLARFGSEIYGATTSIPQFIAYITLLEGGIGGVARAALYKPLAEEDNESISKIIKEIKDFFFWIGIIFFAYVAILACSFKHISNIECLDWISTFLLVWVISLSTFLQYFVGLPYGILLQADQKNYVSSVFSIVTTVLNAVLVFVFVKVGCSIIVVKLISSIVYALKPIAQNIYVKQHYSIYKVNGKSNYLSQKWTGLSQHIAYFIHTNTDIVILTLMKSLKSVSVYSVYNMIIMQIQNVTASFTSGMEALFGELLAKNEKQALEESFEYYDALVSFVSIILFSTTCIMIVPFVKIYTKGVNDANYIEPTFAIVLVASSLVYCLRLPYHSMTVAAGHFKQTKIAAYGEAIINVVLSVVLVQKYRLTGIALATLIASIFRFLYYVFYLSKHILYRKIYLFIKKIVINLSAFMCIYTIMNIVKIRIEINNYTNWILVSGLTVCIAASIESLACLAFYKKEFYPILAKVRKKHIKQAE